MKHGASVQHFDSLSNIGRSTTASSTRMETDVHHSARPEDHAMAQVESTAYKTHGRNLGQNPFLIADRESGRKAITPKQSNIVASRNEEVHGSPTRNVLQPELEKATPSRNDQRHTISRVGDTNMERQDNHRHHFVSLHGTPHVAEHLVDRFRSKLQNWSAQHSTKHSKPMTPVQAVAEKNATEEARPPHGHGWTEPAEKQQRSNNLDSKNLEKIAASKITSWQQRIDDEGRNTTQAKASTGDQRPVVPRGRLNSPPAWLISPQKEPSQAWVHQKLRHVSSQGSHDAWRSHQPDTELPKRPKSSIHEDLRRKRSQVPVAERVKQLQDLDLSRRASEIGTTAHEENAKSISEFCSSQTQTRHMNHAGLFQEQHKMPVSFAKSTSRNMAEHEVIHGKDLEVRPRDLVASPAQHSPQFAGKRESSFKHKFATNMATTNKRLEHFRRQDQYLQESYRQAITKAEAELDRLREEKNKNGKELTEQASSSRITASGFSTPSQILQPRQVPFNLQQREQASDSQTSTEIASRRKEALMVVGKRSDLDLHRPSAVAPPTHECSWRDRYMALTSEIRQLKAEMSSVTRVLESTEHEVMHEDRMLGIESVTIVMHLKDKDDLVINTDLTQEGDE
ncbi:hypothetical protein PFICI_03792 [Pestalotiopsis fici W106-1]|uniref:Uncharacterized protein n=1 Tax=Pestalotiopsis fici (strain W106-1 / CGMCC3.15140) TaxID=1229662 RepID=W3XJY7_PESFW|nr:uncharacterized protein PFICI_03792 [Pestalotiopsis fici W106-1]ETS85767.1 hypothetical protein PFICI_03792 [Pestalotiopsis fici W106-1]